MDTKDWKKASELLEELADLPAPEQQPRLDRACAGNPELRAHVDAMLAPQGEDAAAVEPVHADVLRGLELLPEGHRIGPWHIVREVGLGGMGSVYLAERADGEFEQRVAIKLLRRGLDVERFRLERQILARLHHSHIAQLLDGGTLHDGRPYVVMEFVDGQPLDRYCEDRDLDVAGRLALFRDLCSAVAHAHRNLIIHRDLKPGNILIDRTGTLKLLDFGIAKLLDRDLVRTQTSERRLTPAYASPEQLGGDPISVGSDVYSLGVVLYELLTGQRPFARFENEPRTYEAAVLERVPLRPSECCTLQFAAELRGDLDTIVLKALRSNPERRYATVMDLLDDLARLASGHPIKARRAGPLYRLGKFVSRNRVATAAAVAIVVVAGIQQQRVLHERDLAEQQRDIARLERDRAQRERDAAAANPFYMIDLVSEPEEQAPTPTHRELFDEGVREIDERHGDEPEVQAQLAANMGAVYEAMGRYQSAERMYTEALALERDLYGDESLAAANAQLRLARLHFYKGKYGKAEPPAIAALTLFERHLTREHVDTATAIDLVGSIKRYQGELEAASRYLDEALTLRLTLLGHHHGDTGTTLNNLAGLHKDQGRVDDAIPLYERAVEAFQHGYDGDHPDQIMALNNLAQALHIVGRRAEAEAHYRDALERHDRILGDDRPSLADIAENLGVLLLEGGQLAEARTLLEKALANREEWLAPDHPRTANTHSNLGRVLHLQGELEAAERQFFQARESFIATYGGDHWRVAVQDVGLASVANDAGAFEEALALSQDALEVLEPMLGADHPHTRRAHEESARASAGAKSMATANR